MYTIMHPILEPYQSGMLQVSPIHQIYYEVSGNPHGKTVVYLHGGPGAGTTPTARGFFILKNIALFYLINAAVENLYLTAALKKIPLGI